jgi:broad specificity phosphatase PhoE
MREKFLGLVVAIGLTVLAAHTPELQAQPAPLKPFAGFAPSQNTVPLNRKAQLVRDLQKGGHIVYFRHARTDWSTTDADRDNLANCATQRNLGPEGRTQSESIGKAWQQLGIPVGEVLASPYCRTLETARLAFGRAETVVYLRHLFPESEENFKTVGERMRSVLSTVASNKACNKIVVSHGFNIRPIIGYDPGEGEAVVLRPDGKGGVRDLGRITSEDFVQMAAMQSLKPRVNQAVPC